MADDADTSTDANGPKGCCVPGRDGSVGRLANSAELRATFTGATSADEGARFVTLEGGTFLMGSDDPGAHPLDGEGPVRKVTIDRFAIDETAVTVDRFRRFVEATGYVTESERYGWSFVFAGYLRPDHPPTRAVPQAPWWRQVHGANWKCPEGPHSDTNGRDNHPVVHTS